MKNLDEFKPQDINNEAKNMAEQIVKSRIKTNQLRNFFSAIEKMRTTYRKTNESYEAIELDMIMLKPKIAYAAGRQKSIRYNLYDFVVDAVDAVDNSKDKKSAVTNFFLLIESLVAYHKYYE